MNRCEDMKQNVSNFVRYFWDIFRALPSAGAFCARKIWRPNCNSPNLPLFSLKILSRYLKSFWRSFLDKPTLWKSENCPYLTTGSEIIKKQKNLSRSIEYLSDLKVWYKSDEPSLRNRLHKIGWKNNNNNNNN